MIMKKGERLWRAHWFVPVAMLVVLADVAAVQTIGLPKPGLLEAAILFDLAVLLPGLYLWCYRTVGRLAVLKAAALSCFGIWVAGHIVPDQHHDLLSTVGFARHVGLAILLFVELKLILAVYRAAFSEIEPEERARSAAKDYGMPEWVGRIVALEAVFWRRVWAWVRELIKRIST